MWDLFHFKVGNPTFKGFAAKFSLFHPLKVCNGQKDCLHTGKDEIECDLDATNDNDGSQTQAVQTKSTETNVKSKESNLLHNSGGKLYNVQY